MGGRDVIEFHPDGNALTVAPPAADDGFGPGGPGSSLLRVGQEGTFTFDRVFDASASQADVYDYAARPLVDDVFQGIHATVFAYGQARAGDVFWGGEGFGGGACLLEDVVSKTPCSCARCPLPLKFPQTGSGKTFTMEGESRDEAAKVRAGRV